MKMNIVELLEKFYETELFYLKVGLRGETDLLRRNYTCWYCIQRCLGATHLAEMCGADVKTVEGMFEKTKQEIEILEKTVDI